MTSAHLDDDEWAAEPAPVALSTAAPVDERIAAAVLREADAAGTVKVAAAQLAELQQQDSATPSKIVAAEQKLASAERHHQAARDGVIRTRQKVAEEADRADQSALPAEAEAPPLQFPTLPAFVAYLADLYRREVFDSSERAWCPKWWEHPEAIARLEAMWRALEALRQDPATGISVWFRDHADVHMAQLMQPHGPFRGCTATRGHSIEPLKPLPLDDPPADWWPEEHSGP